ncbi:hypothetical protein CVD25_13085 [Bacillus canaveralius]|uniref:Acyltransferase 3 domain-containing protein n=1 Tax=Bacillus canaveralius TaxID=1403243 RepID=A0A2N5GND4_9BACI|nr:acyltransferase [Bacillus canaveralius]PLR84032.1 hypothetical protein CU635_06920 [Bacillus canaveralius]PLR96323.1 hypothetical protein CVD25_13085 [Bacillus canaveralius]
MNMNYSINSLKFFCILAVINIHTAPFISINPDITFLIKTISRVGVPLFFICSGYFFAQKITRLENSGHTKKYLIKIIKILVSWILIYMVYHISMIILTNLNSAQTIINDARNYLYKFRVSDLYYARETGIIESHLWYLSSLICIIPILYIIIEKDLIGKALTVTLLLNITGVFLPVVNQDMWIITRDAIYFGLFYTTLGAYLAKKETYILQLKSIQYILLALIMASLMLTESYIYRSIFNSFGYYFVFTIPLCTLIFCVCIKNHKILQNSFINKVGNNSLGIYLVHPMIMGIAFTTLSLLNLDYISDSIIWNILFTPCVLIVSHTVCLIIQFIKQKTLVIYRNGVLEFKLTSSRYQ